MEPLGLQELYEQSAVFDSLVAVTPQIDRFCSSTDWILPAASALMPPRAPWLFKSPEIQVALMRGRHPQGWHYLEPLEAMWGLACPIVGLDSGQAAAQLGHLLRRREDEWNVTVLLGLPAGSRLMMEVAKALVGRYEVRQGPETIRCVASLDGGVDGFLGRRSRNFRKALRRTLRAAKDAGIEMVSCRADTIDEARILYRRAVAVELRSWKGRAGVGIESGHMHDFYSAMVPRLARRGGLRLMFAQDSRRAGSRDIAYVMGGMFGSTYRGLQFSYDAEYEHMSLGNFCQYHQIVELCGDGAASYDLGTDMEYKRRWAELTHISIGLIVVKR